MTKQIITAAIVALVISLVAGYLFGGNANVYQPTDEAIKAGGLSERDVNAVTLKLGATGTRHTKFLSGICNAATTELPLEATSTDVFTCTATGVRSGDKVFVSLPYSTAYDLFGGLHQNGDASVSANDTISFHVYNGSGTATSSFPAATTSVTWWAVDN